MLPVFNTPSTPGNSGSIDTGPQDAAASASIADPQIHRCAQLLVHSGHAILPRRCRSPSGFGVAAAWTSRMVRRETGRSGHGRADASIQYSILLQFASQAPKSSSLQLLRFGALGSPLPRVGRSGVSGVVVDQWIPTTTDQASRKKHIQFWFPSASICSALKVDIHFHPGLVELLVSMYPLNIMFWSLNICYCYRASSSVQVLTFVSYSHKAHLSGEVLEPCQRRQLKTIRLVKCMNWC